MNKFPSLFLVFFLSISTYTTAKAELLSEDNVNTINNTWEKIKDGARSVKNSVKETTKDGVEHLGEAYDSIKEDAGELKDEIFNEEEEIESKEDKEDDMSNSSNTIDDKDKEED